MTEIHPHHHGKIFHWIHHGGYPVLFGMLLLCGVGLPLPEDIPLIAAGILVQRGDFNLALAALCAWCGIIGGDCILYTLGRLFGSGVTTIPFVGRHINVNRMARVERWFDHWGVWVVAVCRMFAGVRGAMVVVAGTTKFKFWKFILADGMAAVVSGGLFMLIGYKFGEKQDQIEKLVHEIKGGMVMGAVALLLGIVAYVLWRKRRQRIAQRVAELPGFAVIPQTPRSAAADEV